MPADRSHWLHSAWFDLTFLISPGLVGICIAAAFRHRFASLTDVTVLGWFLIVVCLDGGHTYATFFRTYLHPRELKERRTLLWTAPVLIWAVSVILFSSNERLFWTIWAYVLIFHFIRQQYGVFMLYAHRQNPGRMKTVWLDKAVIYLSTLFPVIYWHTHLPSNHFWFLDHFFLRGLPAWLCPLTAAVYVCIGVLYLTKEISIFLRQRSFSLPKQAVLVGTSVSWAAKILVFRNPMAFALIHLLEHGIPYVALVWLYGNRQQARGQLRFQVYSLSRLPIFVGCLVGAGILEKGISDVFLYHQSARTFGFLWWLPHVTDRTALCFLIPLVSVPPLTHYFLDSFIWRLREKNAAWKEAIFSTDEQPSLELPAPPASLVPA